MPGRRGPGPGRRGPGGPGRRRQRTMRRHRRRRRLLIAGGFVLLGGAHRKHKMKQEDAQKIEQYTGVSVEELEDEELDQAIKELSIQEEPLTAEDEATIAEAGE